MTRSSLLAATGLVLALLVLALPGCTPAKDVWQDAKPGQKRILVSFAPLYCMTQAVAGDDAYVLCLLTTTGPHEYRDSPQDMLKVRKADLVVLNGLGLEPFMERMVAGAGVPKERVVEVGELLPDAMLLHNAEEAEHKHEPGEHHHHHGAHDPHVWLGPPEAIVMVRKIADELSRIDPAHKAGYVKRAEAFAGEVEKLQAEGKELLKGKKNRRLLTEHESLGYFARAFGLEIVDSIKTQSGGGGDLSAKEMDQLSKLCQKKDVAIIAVEPQFDNKIASTLQRDLQRRGSQVQLVEVDPLETAPLAKDSANPEPDFYLRKMRANLETLAKALP